MSEAKPTYRVKINGATEDAIYKSQAAAVRAAKCLDLSLNSVQVVMHVVSGTYQSKTAVWPEVGTTYSN